MKGVLNPARLHSLYGRPKLKIEMCARVSSRRAASRDAQTCVISDTRTPSSARRRIKPREPRPHETNGAATREHRIKTTSLSKPPRRQASRKGRRHTRSNTRLARPFMKLPVVLLALDGAVVGGLAPRTFPEPALLRPAGPTFNFHLRQWRRRRGVVRRLSLRVAQRLDDARSHADRSGDLGERRLHGRVKKEEGPVRVRAQL